MNSDLFDRFSDNDHALPVRGVLATFDRSDSDSEQTYPVCGVLLGTARGFFIIGSLGGFDTQRDEARCTTIAYCPMFAGVLHVERHATTAELDACSTFLANFEEDTTP